MEFVSVAAKVRNALAILNRKDSTLMIDNVNERAIAHQLARKLAAQFPRYDVDCEYDGNSEAIGRLKKRIDYPYALISGFRRRKNHVNISDEEIIKSYILPDIIIHKRRKNENNLLIIEVKKSNSSGDEIDFDKKKMGLFTSGEDDRNNFKYKYGLVLILGCLQGALTDTLLWYENGEMRQEPEMLLKS
jgi:hypothetical protein